MTEPLAASSTSDSIGFILRLGRALHRYGYASDRLEELLAQAAERLQLHGQFFAAPTSIYCGFGELEAQQTFLIRADPGSLNLGKLVDVDRVLTEVLYQRMTPQQGSDAIDTIVAAPPEYGPVVTTIAASLASASAAQFIGGGVKEVFIAGLIGLLLGLLSRAAERFSALGKVYDIVAATVAAAVADALSHVFGPYSVFIATLAGLILLMPGFTLTVALTEMSTRNLISGTTRLTNALIIFFGIGFGVTLGTRLIALWLGASRIGAAWPLPWWAEYLALLIIPIAFAILLQAHARDSIWILLVVVLAVTASRAGGNFFGAELGPFVGALTVGIASKIYAQALQRPSTVTLAPGLLLLVPGSLGFRSIASLLDHQVVPGVEIAVRMILTAMALVAGILISNMLLPVRRR